MLEIRDTPNETPICPHCEKKLNSVNCRKIKSGFGARYLYFCDHCKKVLGISYRKAFWTG